MGTFDFHHFGGQTMEDIRAKSYAEVDEAGNVALQI